MATVPTTRFDRPDVDLWVLVPTLLLIAAEGWYLLAQADSVLVPLIWMAPVDLLLLLYAVDEDLALAEVAIPLFAARVLFLPVLLVARMDSFLLFYALFMAPVDLLIVAYAARAAGGKLSGRAAPA